MILFFASDLGWTFHRWAGARSGCSSRLPPGVGVTRHPGRALRS